MKNIITLLFLFPTICLAEKIQTTGTILFGPEAMFFKECDSNKEWWLDNNSFKAQGWEAVSKELNSQPLCNLSTMPCKHQSAVVSGTALLSNKGNYGHLGMYKRQITFIKLSLFPRDSCKSNGTIP